MERKTIIFIGAVLVVAAVVAFVLLSGGANVSQIAQPVGGGPPPLPA